MRYQFLGVLLFSFLQGFGQWAPVSPLGIPLLVTAGFGEVRSQHFHSGLDFSTGHRQQPVYAVEDGEIYRIRTAAGGYGKAVYIHHPNGIGSVYAHLDRFAPEIEAFVRNIQLKQMRFDLDTLIHPGQIKISKGQLIAFSGNTGSSTAPHLHFELRDRATEAVLNPLEYGFAIHDTHAPEIRSVVLLPMKGYGQANASSGMLTLPLIYNKQTKKKSLSPKVKMPVLSGWVGFGYRGGDVIGKARNLSGIYEIKILVDSIEIFHARFDRFSFSETRCVNGYIDYPTRVRSKAVVHRCVVPANNMIGIYKDAQNRGYFYFDQHKVYKVRYILSDVAGNSTVQEIRVRGAKPTFSIAPLPADNPSVKTVYPAEDQSLASDNFEAEFWKECLFDTARIQLREKPVSGAYSPEVAFGSMYIPINQAVLIRMKPAAYPAWLRDKLVIVRQTGNKEVSLGGYWVGDWLSGKTTEFGDFKVVADTIPPKITYIKSHVRKAKASPKKKKSQPKTIGNVSDEKPPEYPKAVGTARFRIREFHSGLKDIHAWLNDQWVLLEPDDETGVYMYPFPDDLKPGVQCLRISVTDGSGNTGQLEMEFEKLQ